MALRVQVSVSGAELLVVLERIYGIQIQPGMLHVFGLHWQGPLKSRRIKSARALIDDILVSSNAASSRYTHNVLLCCAGAAAAASAHHPGACAVLASAWPSPQLDPGCLQLSTAVLEDLGWPQAGAELRVHVHTTGADDSRGAMRLRLCHFDSSVVMRVCCIQQIVKMIHACSYHVGEFVQVVNRSQMCTPVSCSMLQPVASLACQAVRLLPLPV
jgi:hypothetical protein